MICHSIYDSPVGPLHLSADDRVLRSVRFEGGQPTETNPILQQTENWLDRYFSGRAPDPRELPLAPEGSAFQKLIWDLLLQIPWGDSTTYGCLARQAAGRMGKERMSAQAVGNAVGKNPIGIIIPCHRVLGSGGSLTGFSGGMEIKRRLLDLEGIPYRE